LNFAFLRIDQSIARMGFISPDYADMVEFIQGIIAARPDHVVWGQQLAARQHQSADAKPNV
jgi:hypothetical protein